MDIGHLRPAAIWSFCNATLSVLNFPNASFTVDDCHSDFRRDFIGSQHSNVQRAFFAESQKITGIQFYNILSQESQ